MTFPLALTRFTAASISGMTAGSGDTGASCEIVKGMPSRTKVLAAAACAARSAPQKRLTASPAEVSEPMRKLGTAPTAFMCAIWSGRR